MANKVEKKKTQARAPDAKVYETAICFARMWGVMETLEPLQNLGFETIKDIVIELAKEYVSKDEKDLNRFFEERAEMFKRKYSS